MAKVGMQKGKRGPVKEITKAKFPVLKSRARAGFAEKPIPRGLKAAAMAKVKAKTGAGREVEMEVEMEVEKEVEMEIENQSITNTTTADRVAEALRARVPHRAPQSPQRRSRRVLERTRKSPQDKPAVASTVQEEGEVARGSPVEETIAGPSGEIAANTVAKVGVEKQRGGVQRLSPGSSPLF